MSEHAQPFAPGGHGGGQGAVAPLALLVREAQKDGERIVRMACVRQGEGFVVECEIRRPGELAGAAPEVRSYRFAERHEATQFVDDAALALEYLGCSIS